MTTLDLLGLKLLSMEKSLKRTQKKKAKTIVRLFKMKLKRQNR